MSDNKNEPFVWNDPARISCEFVFKCPRTWERLAPTEQANIRHCSECNRDVHLVLSEEDFRRHGKEGHCMAVKVLVKGEDEPGLSVGMIDAPYGDYLDRI